MLEELVTEYGFWGLLAGVLVEGGMFVVLAGIAAFLFGVVDDALQKPALAALARICKPDGEIRLLDHCCSRDPFWRLYMAAWLPWEKMVYGGAFDRPTAGLMPETGLRLTKRELVFKDMVQLVVACPNGA